MTQRFIVRLLDANDRLLAWADVHATAKPHAPRGASCPFVAPPTPIEGIYAAVTRRTIDGQHPDGWVPGEKITVEEALVAYTLGGAFASFEENEKGRIKPGLLADLTMIDKDLRSLPPAEIRTARVTRTIVGGRTVFQR